MLPTPRSSTARSATRPTSTAAARQAHQAWLKGVELARAERHESALPLFRTAVQKAPGDAVYWINLARSQHKLERYDEAIASARHAFELAPDSEPACQLLAESLRKTHRNAEALKVISALNSGDERSAGWHLLRGSVLLEERQPAEACQAFLSALAAPDCDQNQRVKGMMQLGQCLATLRRHYEAGQCFRTVLDLEPESLGAALYAAHYSAWACDWPELESDMQRLSDCVQQLRATLDAEARVQGLSPFCLLTLTDDPQLLKWAAELACRRRAVNEKKWVGQRVTRLERPGGKLRIGLVSSDFHHHATTMLVAEVLEHIDTSRFELYFYSGGIDDRSALRQRVMRTATAVRETAQWDNDRLAEAVRSDRIGVLVDMKGFTAGSRMGALAQRPAPLQVAWLGYPGTCGADFIDYVIGDPIVTPMEAADDFTEHIAQMPHCYQPNDSRRSVPAPLGRAECQLPEGALVFASFNQAYKVIPAVFMAWCRVLAATPDSVLWLLVPDEETQQRLRREARAQGVDAGRLIFAPFMDIEQHRARLPNADLFLDTYPCSGHTTASDALWAAVPMLTIAGQGFASRVAASLLDTVGLPDLVCLDVDEYIDKALELAQDRPRLQALREHLVQARTASPAFDGRQYAKDFEALLLRMVERHEAGLPPAGLPADEPVTLPTQAALPPLHLAA
ncbi:putative O-linked N-acetylglucosamine transferase (SPINDLY family) [Sphaerotilus hippei]|uniref:protein O-GlcNAc transferase n=1 Tax=Sphaerotilus hippei TaxID=744406 RepID=A0A318GU48_9BURK|nr:tetratricopeptide repeat protein [Sphaerotilus hippei]PXW91926.1 putative O-linked N-acetylglucosamine transferase (SPINDLY family) [Sphaerotilus hippei]